MSGSCHVKRKRESERGRKFVFARVKFKGQQVKVRVEVKVKVTFISISPLLSKVKVPHTSNADAVSRLTWIRKADHCHLHEYDDHVDDDDCDDDNGHYEVDDDGHDEDDVKDTYAGHMFQALKPC